MLKNLIRTFSLGAIVFILFLGIGYPTLNRYDPKVAIIKDPLQYYAVAFGQNDIVESPFNTRVLIPYTVRFVYDVIKAVNLNVGSWNTVNLSFLIVNSLLLTASIFVLFRIAYSIYRCRITSLISCLLLGTNFIVVNSHLAGMIDSGELLLILLAVLVLRENRLHYLPLLFLFAGLCKETAVLFLSVGVLASLLMEYKEQRLDLKNTVLTFSSIIVGSAVLFIVQMLVGAVAYVPHQFSMSSLLDIPFQFTLVFSNPKGLVYTFLLLVPLSLTRLRYVPKNILIPWMLAGFSAFVLGLYARIGADNLARPLFDTCSIVLILASAGNIKEMLFRDSRLAHLDKT